MPSLLWPLSFLSGFPTRTIRLPFQWTVWLSLSCLVALLSGCGKSDTTNPSDAGADAKLPLAVPTETDPQAPSSLTPLPPTSGQPAQGPDAAVGGQAMSSPQADVPAHNVPAQTPAMLPLAEPESVIDAPDSKRRQLRADLSPQELRDFLADADRTMQAIANGTAGIQDPKEAFAEMQRISKLKLEASRRLRNMPAADAEARRDGARGELQSLSHLAALGDLKAALELEKLAEANLESDDPRLVTDSRLVLIGFAIESLQNGAEDAPKRMVQLVHDLANSPASSEIPAMMVMGQARQTLTQFGHDAEAKAIRGTIIDLYADSTDPQIAKMAAQLAGSVQFDEIDRLLRLAIEGGSVDPTDWKAAAEALINESPDLQTVQYLAGAALQFEGLGHQELAEATYRELSDRFPDANSATGQEALIALDARKSRLDAIGQPFAPDLKAVDGSALSLADYRGKIVLMPLWATGFPESLQLIPHLQQLVDQDPDKLAIVGVNLDPTGAPVDEFVRHNQFTFPNLRAESSNTAEVANEVAAKLGMVSMPFLVVLDQEGRIASIDYTIGQLQKTLDRLQQ